MLGVLFLLKPVTNSNLNFCLQNRLVGYEQWAARARRDAVERLNNRREDEIQVLSAGCQAGIASTKGRITALETHIEHLTRTLAQKSLTWDANQASLIENQNVLINGQRLMLQALKELTTKVDGNAPPAPTPVPVAAPIPVAAPVPAPAPAEVIECYAVRECTGLKGAALFFDWVDVEYYVEESEGRTEFETFQSVSEAWDYLRGDRPARVVASAVVAPAVLPLTAAPVVAAAAAALRPRHPPLGNRNAARNVLAERHKASVAENAVACLTSVPRQPSLGKLPESWCLALDLWEAEDMPQYQRVGAKALWSDAMKSKYTKLSNIIEKVVRRNTDEAAHDGTARALDTTAYYMDMARIRKKTTSNKSWSLTQDLGHYRSQNPFATKRVVVSRTRVPKAKAASLRAQAPPRREQRQPRRQQEIPAAQQQQQQQQPAAQQQPAHDRFNRPTQRRQTINHRNVRWEPIARGSNQRHFDPDDYDRGV